MSSHLNRIAATAAAVVAAMTVGPVAAFADNPPPSLPPDPSALPAPGSPVTPTAGCVVPSLKGLTLRAASVKLEQTGCRLGRVTRASVRGVRVGLVAGQSARTGITLTGGAPVALTVSAAF